MSIFENCRCLIVGAGIWGSVLAERLASVAGIEVLVIDRRGHSGGNCHSAADPETGIECHRYGTHIFHTKRREVWDYVNAFTGFNTYRHKVLTEYKGKVYPMPIGLETINSYYGLKLKPFEAEAFIRSEAEKEGIVEARNLEEKAVSLIGRPLYEAFIKGYTQKQWNKHPTELPAAIITRLPVRTNYNFDYFDDPWQGMPLAGYHGLFDAMLKNDKISLRLGLDYKDIRQALPADCRVFYSGAIDEFFDYSLGALEWRSLRFEEEVKQVADFQGCAVMNQAEAELPYTRTHEYRHLHPERAYSDKATVIVREYPQDYSGNAERYYPVNTPGNQALLAQYQELAAAKAPGVTFGGRLGSYRYLDMDMAIHEALTLFASVMEQGGI
ncbi:UDP-galactopyranose mutase [Desulfovibrio sp. OttesenSCG-928-A18]|nr:UDP-galactopyranose mutase [Desulfovibrio sp. OttesenSCG-928-A18]